MKLIVEPASGPLHGTITVPGDKSIGHRALLFSLLSQTPIRVLGLGDGADNGRSARAIAALGAKVAKDGNAIVITGKVEKFFSAGADINMLSSKSLSFKNNFALHGHEVLMRLENTPKIVIAAINWHAVGGGLDYENADPRQQQHRNPTHRCDEAENDPGKYQPYSNPPQHHGISFSL